MTITKTMGVVEGEESSGSGGCNGQRKEGGKEREDME